MLFSSAHIQAQIDTRVLREQLVVRHSSVRRSPEEAIATDKCVSKLLSTLDDGGNLVTYTFNCFLVESE